MAAGIWVRLVRRGHVLRDTTVPCAREDWEDALTEACHALDLQKPFVMPRHQRDLEQFGLTRFLPEHFVEEVPFDRMELEYIEPDAKKGSSVNEKYL